MGCGEGATLLVCLERKKDSGLFPPSNLARTFSAHSWMRHSGAAITNTCINPSLKKEKNDI